MDKNFFFFTMDVEQQANDVRLDADRQKLDYGNFMDDEEVMLLHHKRDMNVPDNPGSDGLDTSDTQRETGYFRRSLSMGLVPGGRQRSYLR